MIFANVRQLDLVSGSDLNPGKLLSLLGQRMGIFTPSQGLWVGARTMTRASHFLFPRTHPRSIGEVQVQVIYPNNVTYRSHQAHRS